MFDELLERLLKVNLQEGFSELLGEVPGIDAKGRRIFYVALRSGLLSIATEEPKDDMPDLETMAEDLSGFLLHLTLEAKLSAEEREKFRNMYDYYEKYKDDKGIIASGYLVYLIIPELVDILKEAGLWNKETDEPIYPTERHYEYEDYVDMEGKD